MKEVQTDLLLQEVSKLLDRLNCDYLLALFPSDENGCKTVSMGINLDDIDGTALLLSKIMLEGGEMGWNLLKLLQKTCRAFPLPLSQLLAASQADYKELAAALLSKGGVAVKASKSSKGAGGGIKVK